jgi:hypothetical protein
MGRPQRQKNVNMVGNAANLQGPGILVEKNVSEQPVQTRAPVGRNLWQPAMRTENDVAKKRSVGGRHAASLRRFSAGFYSREWVGIGGRSARIP